MSVFVEFFGMPRRYAGCDRLEVAGSTLGEVLRDLSQTAPDFGRQCLQDGVLRRGYLASVNGRHFTNDPATLLVAGDSVQILSADAGG